MLNLIHVRAAKNSFNFDSSIINPFVDMAILRLALAPSITASYTPGCNIGSPSPKKPIALTPILAASLRNLTKVSVGIILLVLFSGVA